MKRKTIAIVLCVMTLLGTAACRKPDSQAEQQLSEQAHSEQVHSEQSFAESMENIESMESIESTEPAAPETESARVDRETEKMEGAEDPDSQGGRVLVVYFSATNKTRRIAEYIAGNLEADIYEIVPADPYTDEDRDYNDSSSRTSIEMNDPDVRPEISGSVEEMEQYEIIFLGYPIWWGDAPRIMSTFVESYDFAGKTIVPFCTSGSSSIGSSAANLEQLTSGAEWLDGRRWSGSDTEETVMEWVYGLGLDLGE